MMTIINLILGVVILYYAFKFFTQNKEDVKDAKRGIKTVLKIILAIPVVVIATSILFVLSQFIKDTFFLGPEPDLAGKSILFEAEGEGVQLFWRHYKENNEYTEEYLFDEPIEGRLSDVLLRDDGLWFVIQYRASSIDIRDIYVYGNNEDGITELAFFEDGGGSNLVHISTTDEVELEKRERDSVKDSFYFDSRTIFESNYFSLSNQNILSTDIGDVPCPQSFGGFGLPCFIGYLKTDKLIRNSDNEVLFKVRELVTPPFGAIMLGKRFTSGVILRNDFMFSKDQQFAFQFTYNAESRKSTTYLVHIDSGKVMKISKGDVPVLMP